MKSKEKKEKQDFLAIDQPVFCGGRQLSVWSWFSRTVSTATQIEMFWEKTNRMMEFQDAVHIA